MSSVSQVKERMKARLRSNAPSRSLYSARNTEVVFSVDGIIFRIPPQGILEVEDVYVIDPDSIQKARKEKRPLPQTPDKLLVTADDVIAHAIAHLEGTGVRWLEHVSEAGDEEIKALATQEFDNFQFEQDVMLVQRYHNQVDAFRANPANAGKPVRPMNKWEQQAQDRIDDAKLGKTQHKQFICEFNCGAEYDTAEKRERHYLASHPLKAAPSVAASAEPAAPRRKRGRPRKEVPTPETV